MITSLDAPDAAHEAAVAAVGSDRVLVPAVLKLRRVEVEMPRLALGGSR